jgi:hypothetical protein
MHSWAYSWVKGEDGTLSAGVPLEKQGRHKEEDHEDDLAGCLRTHSVGLSVALGPASRRSLNAAKWRVHIAAASTADPTSAAYTD